MYVCVFITSSSRWFWLSPWTHIREPLLFPIELKAEVSPNGHGKKQIPKNLPLGPHGVTKNLVQILDVCMSVCVCGGRGWINVCFCMLLLCGFLWKCQAPLVTRNINPLRAGLNQTVWGRGYYKDLEVTPGASSRVAARLPKGLEQRLRWWQR